MVHAAMLFSRSKRLAVRVYLLVLVFCVHLAVKFDIAPMPNTHKRAAKQAPEGREQEEEVSSPWGSGDVSTQHRGTRARKKPPQALAEVLSFVLTAYLCWQYPGVVHTGAMLVSRILVAVVAC